MKTTTDVVFDTWAWWEVLAGSVAGLALQARFLHDGDRPYTSAWALGELVAKVDRHAPNRLREVVQTVRDHSRVVEVNEELAIAGALLRNELRKSAPRASLGDGVMLATARQLGLRLVSGDTAFEGQKDVIRG